MSSFDDHRLANFFDSPRKNSGSTHARVRTAKHTLPATAIHGGTTILFLDIEHALDQVLKLDKVQFRFNSVSRVRTGSRSASDSRTHIA